MLQQITAHSSNSPATAQDITLYTSLGAYGSFYLAVVPIYARMTSKPYPSAEELISMDDRIIVGWYSALPPYFSGDSEVPAKHRLSQAVLMWKYRNFRILMYRPFVVRDMLGNRRAELANMPQGHLAQDRCMHEAETTIMSIKDFWDQQEHTRLAAWYALCVHFIHADSTSR